MKRFDIFADNGAESANGLDSKIMSQDEKPANEGDLVKKSIEADGGSIERGAATKLKELLADLQLNDNSKSDDEKRI